MITSRGQTGLLVLILASVSAHDGGGLGGLDGSRSRDDRKAEANVLVVEDDGFAEIRATPEYRLAHREGRSEARAALESGQARLLSYGLLGMADLDPETGLAVVPISGCVVTAEILGRTEGNNEAVRDWVKRRGPAPNALLRWTEELSDLPAFFARRSKAGAAIPLKIGGPTLTSPDGRFTLRQVAVRVDRGSPPDVRKVITVGLEVSEREAFREVLTDDWGDGLTDLVWGPPGAPFAVIKSRGSDGPDFQILHLRPVEWVIPAELSWQRYLKEHPESPLKTPD
jgi:hypothetical protein